MSLLCCCWVVAQPDAPGQCVSVVSELVGSRMDGSELNACRMTFVVVAILSRTEAQNLYLQTLRAVNLRGGRLSLPREGGDVLCPEFLQPIGSSLRASKQPGLSCDQRLPCAAVSLKPWRTHCTVRHFIYVIRKIEIIMQNLMTFNCLYSNTYKTWLAITCEKLQSAYVWINYNGQ